MGSPFASPRGLQAAFDCDIDVATRLHASGAQLPGLFPLMLDMHARRLPTETEASSATYAPHASVRPTSPWLRRRQATAIYVIEGLRTGSPEGRGATAALMRVAREHWHDVPDLNATLRSVCMVADAEFSETTEDMPPFLQEASDARPAACGARPLLSDPAPRRRLSRRTRRVAVPGGVSGAPCW